MPTIKSISDFRNKSNDISKLVNESSEPVFITKNGEGDMVVMSIVNYERMQKKIRLLTDLAVARQQQAAGDQGRLLSHVMKDLRTNIKSSDC